MFLLLGSIHVFPLRGFIFYDIHKKNKEGVQAIQATKYEKYMAAKFTRAAHLWRESTQIEYSRQKMAQQIV